MKAELDKDSEEDQQRSMERIHSYRRRCLTTVAARGISLEAFHQIQSALQNSERAEPYHGGTNIWGYSR